VPQSNKIALVIGASGGVGGETASALKRHGWTIRALTRRPQPADPVVEWISGDAMNAADVLRAAESSSLIVHAANPPGYRDWDKVVLPMLDNTIAASKANGARIVLPGSIYNFGPDAFPVLREDSPQHPVTRKGAIRVAMEQRLQAAAAGGAPVLIVRAGDFFGPTTSGNSVFSAAMVERGKPVGRIVDPSRTSHGWAYLPDLAETIARLIDRESDLATFERFHFAGHQLAKGEMAAAIRRAVGNPNLHVWPFPWFIVFGLSPFVTLFRETKEMRYLWREPIVMDGSRLKAFLGDALPATPLDDAVRTTLVGLGCLQ
jgi:nucleoside-diphosphate-sugar epimerase